MDLFIFNGINDNPVIKALLEFKENRNKDAYYRAARGLIEYSSKRITDKNLIREYTLRAILEQDNLPDIVNLRDFLRRDVKTIFNVFFETNWDYLFTSSGFLPLCCIQTKKTVSCLNSYALSIESMIDCASNEALGGAILAHTESFGTGKTSAYAMLNWDGSNLIGIENIDNVAFEDLLGIEKQKYSLILNTENFICSRPASHMILSGCSGMGKTSSIKACLNFFKDSGLRIIEVKPSQVDELPKIFNRVRESLLKYIIFIDGISNDSCARSKIDGCMGGKPENVLVYAIAENPIEDFGINLEYDSLTDREYIEIIEKLMEKEDLSLDDELLSKALAEKHGDKQLSVRFAKQFVTGILSAV